MNTDVLILVTNDRINHAFMETLKQWNIPDL